MTDNPNDQSCIINDLQMLNTYFKVKNNVIMLCRPNIFLEVLKEHRQLQQAYNQLQ